MSNIELRVIDMPTVESTLRGLSENPTAEELNYLPEEAAEDRQVQKISGDIYRWLASLEFLRLAVDLTMDKNKSINNDISLRNVIDLLETDLAHVVLDIIAEFDFEGRIDESSINKSNKIVEKLALEDEGARLSESSDEVQKKCQQLRDELHFKLQSFILSSESLQGDRKIDQLKYYEVITLLQNIRQKIGDAMGVISLMIEFNLNGAYGDLNIDKAVHLVQQADIIVTLRCPSKSQEFRAAFSNNSPSSQS